jgi:hypothetical protein
MAAQCERFAAQSTLPSTERLLLEMAEQWRSLAVVPREVLTAQIQLEPTPTLDDQALAELLSSVGSPLR